jgi:hypothetical protein
MGLCVVQGANRLAPCCCALPSILHTAALIVPLPSHNQVKKADALDAVALVMSSQNKGRVAEFFLGSCTQ